MELALIDDDSLYQLLFLDFFKENFNIVPRFFESASKFSISDARSLDFIIVDHTLKDGSGINLIQKIRPHTRAAICLISTYGKILTPINKTLLGVSGDLSKTDMRSVGDWYNYFSPDFKKKLQKPDSKT